MNDEPTTQRGELPLDVLNRIDSLCDAYEQALARGERPGVEDYLARVDATYREILRRELSAIRVSATGSEPTIDLPAPHDADATTQGDSSRSESLPRRTTVRYFGDYEIQRELGRGGMGVVYRARQQSLNRPVALKMIKAGALADEAELHRFQREAEAVALLDHLGIVPVYEVGEHEGQKYYSMKLIDGGNLATSIEKFRDRPRVSASLVADIAEAVHHAHMRGILHRDLKPANVLLDAEGHPHVTDFGLAKRLQDDAESTQSGAILGTPAYMSPEQASGRRDAITTATDVYSLGAILYALLTGKPPFGGDSLIETLEAVRNNAPMPPTRVNAKVPRDLETITLKCLEKDPRRRYASAQALADDLRNWLSSRPIAARRVGAGERLWLWCRRRPAVAALGTTAMAAIVIGTATTIAVLLISNAAIDRQRIRAEAREQQAIEAVERFRAAVVAEPALHDSQELEQLRNRLLKEPLEFFAKLRDQLLADNDTRPATLERLAQAQFDLATTTNEVGDMKDSVRLYREAVTIREQLVRDFPNEERFARQLAQALNNMGVELKEIGDLKGAREVYERARPIHERLEKLHPKEWVYGQDLALTDHNLGVVLREMGDLPGSRAAHERAVKLQQRLVRENPSVPEATRELAWILTSYGTVLQRAEDFQGAKKAFRQAIDIHWAQAFSFPKVDVHAKELASVQNNLAVLYAETGEQAKALDLYREVCKTQERLAKKRPSDHELAIQLARTYSNLGNLLQQRNDPAAAREEFARALAIKEGLMRAYPEVGSYQEDVALGLKLLGDVTGVEGNFEEARRLFERAIDLQEDLIQRYPHVESYASELASQCTELGLLLLQHAPREARPALERACTNARRLLTAHPDSAQEASRLGGALNNLAILDLMERRFLDARRRLVEAVRLQKQALDAKPADPVFRQFLGNHYRELARAAHALADASLEAEANAGLAELTANNPALQVLDARLDAVKAGAAPRDHTERVELARRAYDRRLYALAARLWGEAIARDPEFAADRQAQHRYNAACAAALAAAGKDKEESTLDDGEKARLRHAAAWGLGEDLQAWAALLRSPSKGQVERVVVTLTHWQVDPDLAVIRDPAQLEALPESERRSLESLWHDVERTLARAFVMACDSRFPRDAFAR